MEKLKKLLNPGKEHEDEVLYGSGTDRVVAGTDHPQTYGHGNQVGSSDSTWNEPHSVRELAGTSESGTGKAHHRGTGGPAGAGGVDEPYPPSNRPGVSDDTSTTASIKSGVPGKDQSRSLAGPYGTGDPLDTNKPLPHEPTNAGLTDPTPANSAGPHPSSWKNKLDPRVDTHNDQNRGVSHDRGTTVGHAGNMLPDRTVGSSGYEKEPQSTDTAQGRDALLGAGAGVGIGAGTAATLHHKRDQDDLRASATAGPHSSHLANKADPRVDSDLDGSRTAGNAGTGLGAAPISGAGPQGTSGQDHQTGSSRDAGILQAGGPNPIPGHGPESWKHDHDHEFVGDPCAHHAVKGDPLFTKGPHVTDTANLLDPHVTPKVGILPASTLASSDRELGSIAVSGDHLGRHLPELGSTTPGGDHHGRDAGVVGGLGAAGAGAYSSSRSDVPSAEHTSTTTEPHHSKLLNKLDPRVHSDPSGSEKPATTAETSALIGSSKRGTAAHMPTAEVVGATNDQGRHARTTGVAGYEDPSGSPLAPAATSTGGIGSHDTSGHTATTTGPHHSKLLNKLDPRAHTDSSGSDRPASTAETSALIGSSKPGSSSHMPPAEVLGASHDHGRDARSAGVGGFAGHEASRGSPPVPLTTSTAGVGTHETSATNREQYYGDDTGRDPHKDKGRGLASHLPGFLGGHHDKSNEPAGSGHNEGQDISGTDARSGSGHHYGRDAGLAGAGIGGGVAAYEAQKVHNRGRDLPITETDASTHPPPGRGDDGRTVDTYAGRDATPVGGIGSGSGATDGSEFSKREAEKLAEARQKEFEREQKAIHKEHVRHEKALEKEERRHEKLEREHEKELKEERKHHDDGKKHGGILGMFHRDKTEDRHANDELDQHPDRSLKATETTTDVGAGAEHDESKKRGGILGIFHRDKSDSRDEDDEVGRGAEPDAGIDAGVQHKHEPNKLHKDPPPGYYESKGYAPPRTGDIDHTNPSAPGGFASEASGGQGRIMNPETDLPVDRSTGTGRGGTDGGPMPGI